MTSIYVIYGIRILSGASGSGLTYAIILPTKFFRVMADHLHINVVSDEEGGDTTTLQAFRSKATELLAKPKLDVRLFGYTLPERLQELRDAISLKSMF